jgi:hypothetical protein
MRSFLPFALLGLLGCSAGTTVPFGTDASTDTGTGGDGQSADAGKDAFVLPDGCVGPVTDAGTVDGGGTDTCMGLGPGFPCDTACGFPTYGYLCVSGAPSKASGCVLARASGGGEAWCCSSLSCVRVTSKDSSCASSSGKPKLYQCYQDADAGGIASPPAGCVEINEASITSSRSKAFCCP